MKKRIRILRDELAPFLSEITTAIMDNSKELVSLANEMTPPVPIILVDEMRDRHHLPSTGLLINSALRQTMRNLASISEAEWMACFDEYVLVAKDKGSNNPSDELVIVDGDSIAMSDKIAEHLDVYFQQYKKAHPKTAISHARVNDKTSHKIIVALAIIYTARFLISLKINQN